MTNTPDGLAPVPDPVLTDTIQRLKAELAQCEQHLATMWPLGPDPEHTRENARVAALRFLLAKVEASPDVPAALASIDILHGRDGDPDGEFLKALRAGWDQACQTTVDWLQRGEL
jgi:hypothetical protein